MSSPSISALTFGKSFNAAMQALTKKPMKPRRTPCFFSKLSLYSVRSAMTWLISTSLKVVSCAAVFCDSLRRSAIVRRSRVIATRSSRSAFGRGPAGIGARTAAGRCAARASSAASTSPLVTRPSLPVPATAAGSRPDLRAMRRADGIAATATLGFGAGAGFGAAAAAWLRRRCLAAAGFGAAVFRSFRRRCTLVAAPALGDCAQDGADLNCVAFLDGDRFDRAVGRRGDFDRDLVGLEFEDRLVAGDGVALFLEPARNGCFRHGFAHGRDLDVDAHRAASLLTRVIHNDKASSRNARSSAVC